MADAVEVRDERIREVFGETEVVALQGGFQFLEGPVWRAERRQLVFSDMAGDCLWALDAAGRIAPYRQPSRKANGNTVDRAGRLITCEHATSRVVREEADGRLTILASTYAGRELNSPNDVIVSPDGTVLFTDPTFGRQEFFGVPRPESQEVRAVYAVDPAVGVVRRVCDGFEQPNGLCLAPGGDYLYVNDTARGHIKRFAFGDGAARAGVVWAEVTGQGEGSPDGMKADAAGRVFCTGPGGLHVFAPDGTALGVLRVPAPIANFAWGDEDLRTVYLCGGSTLFRARTLTPGVLA
jgi:gluconolactonase